ncbi:MAG: efflux RND transporter periplasmic adaptor subunit [Myxococcales bacterium]|nr:efflux RND transporter periplasmic adaptor subunit [Myxococcales bacterium]
MLATTRGRWIGGRVLALGLALGGPGCERDPAPRDADAGEPAATDEAADDAPPPREPEGDAMVGVLVPSAEVVLVATGFARLERLDVQVGDHVGEGAVVAEMDVRGDKSELASATAAWKASKAELERLELELQQARASRADVEQLEDFVSRAELREQRFAEKLAGARKRSAGASLSQQRSKMEEASARIAEAELRAPFAGVIAKRYVDPGATLSTGEPVVQIIADARLVRFAVPEERGDALRLGAPVRVRFEDVPLEVSGTVSTIAPEIDAGTRLILAEAELRLDDAQRELLRVGTVGRVRFAGG